MSAPRIDTFRNTIDAVIVALTELRGEAADLHDLAYSRYRAAQESKVRGGSPDYALDNHGDPNARELYKEAARDTVGLGRSVLSDLDRIKSYLTAGAGAVRRRDKSADAPTQEVAEAMAAAERRRSRGEHVPHNTAAAPVVVFADAERDLLNLSNAVRKMAKGMPANRGLLTPAEQDAWRRAMNSQPAGHRRGISDLVKRAVFERDGRACVECGGTSALELDHIIPYSQGGPDTVDNLRVLCRRCNASKGARPLVQKIGEAIAADG